MEKFKIRIPIEDAELGVTKENIEEAIISHQAELEPLFEREILDFHESRLEIIDESLEIHEIVLDGSSGSVEGEFMSYFYAGCKDMNSEDWHDIVFNFTIDNNEIIIDMPLKPRWTEPE